MIISFWRKRLMRFENTELFSKLQINNSRTPKMTVPEIKRAKKRLTQQFELFKNISPPLYLSAGWSVLLRIFSNQINQTRKKFGSGYVEVYGYSWCWIFCLYTSETPLLEVYSINSPPSGPLGGVPNKARMWFSNNFARSFFALSEASRDQNACPGWLYKELT